MKNKLSLCKQFLASNFSNIFFLLSPLATFLVVEILEYGASGQTSWHSGQISCFTTVFSFCSVRSPDAPVLRLYFSILSF